MVKTDIIFWPFQIEFRKRFSIFNSIQSIINLAHNFILIQFNLVNTNPKIELEFKWTSADGRCYDHQLAITNGTWRIAVKLNAGNNHDEYLPLLCSMITFQRRPKWQIEHLPGTPWRPFSRRSPAGGTTHSARAPTLPPAPPDTQLTV